jgi:hypothetical protein
MYEFNVGNELFDGEFQGNHILIKKLHPDTIYKFEVKVFLKSKK